MKPYADYLLLLTEPQGIRRVRTEQFYVFTIPGQLSEGIPDPLFVRMSFEGDKEPGRFPGPDGDVTLQFEQIDPPGCETAQGPVESGGNIPR